MNSQKIDKKRVSKIIHSFKIKMDGFMKLRHIFQFAHKFYIFTVVIKMLHL